MRARTLTALLTLSVGGTFVVLGAPDAPSQPTSGGPTRFEVKVTNATSAQRFTPLLVVTHNPAVELFELGGVASAELTALAEFGDTTPFVNALGSSPDVFDIQTTGGLLDPGKSVSVIIETKNGLDSLPRISLAGMLIPTNDAFVAVNGVTLPLDLGESIQLNALAYDAGTEVNDERCSSIPGPFFSECSGPGGGGSPGGGEGFVHVHRGMQGVGDMDAAMRDWRNPVATVSIRALP